jgi:flagellar biosynthesis/type III secretory pathway protein FliH
MGERFDGEKLTIGEYAHQEGLQEGLREGLREGKEQMAEALRALGVDEDIIRSAMEYPLQKK